MQWVKSYTRLVGIVAIFVSVFGNLWIWAIAHETNFFALVSIVTSFLYIFHFLWKGKLLLGLCTLGFLLILVFQIRSSTLVDLASFSNDETRIRDTRMEMYPQNRISSAYYFEQKPIVVSARRLYENVFNSLDINQYFFAGHPRERVGVDEFEKFSYAMIFPFFMGVYEIVKKRPFFLFYALVPFMASGYFAPSHELGLVSAFPFFVLSIFAGLRVLARKKYLYIYFLAFYLLSMIQIISYEAF